MYSGKRRFDILPLKCTKMLGVHCSVIFMSIKYQFTDVTLGVGSLSGIFSPDRDDF
jgi:hypothetical protein